MNIGERIRELRLEAHLTTAEFARLIGVTRQRVDTLEHQKDLSAEMIYRISNALNLDYNTLIAKVSWKRRERVLTRALDGL